MSDEVFQREGGWTSKLFRETGILPEDMRKNHAHPEIAAYERRLQEAME